MIADLKADSARWSQEQARSRDPRGTSEERNYTISAPNKGVVAYQDSQVHQSRQYWGPTSSAPAQSGQTTTSSGYTAPQGASSYQVSSSGHGYSSPSYPPGGSSGRQSQYPPSSGSYHQSPAYTTSTSSPPASYPAQVSYPAYHQGEGQQDPYAATPGYQGYAQQPYQPADPRNPQNPYGYPPRDGSASGTSQAGAYPYSQTGGYPPSQRYYDDRHRVYLVYR